MNIHDFGSNDYQKLFSSIQPEFCTVSKLFIYGPPKSGKTYLIKHLINSLENYKKVYLSLSDCLDVDKEDKHVYENLLYKFNDSDNYDPKKFSASDADEFIFKVKDYCLTNSYKYLYIIIDNVEKLTETNFKLLSVLARLNDYIDSDEINIITIFISQTPYYQLFVDMSDLEMFTQYVPSFTPDEIKSIILSNYNENKYKKEFNLYVDQMLNGILPFCNDLVELQYIIKYNWKKIYNDVERTQFNYVELTNMYKNCLRSALARLYNHNVDSHYDDSIISNYEQGLHLPIPCRYLLMASYVASYNSKSSDKNIFISNTDRLSKQRKHKNVNLTKTTNYLNGPKFFTLERLFAIFLALYREKWDRRFNTDILYKLINSKLILPSSKDSNPLKIKKYRCGVSFDCVNKVGESVNYDLKTVLTDYYSL